MCVPTHHEFIDQNLYVKGKKKRFSLYDIRTPTEHTTRNMHTHTHHTINIKHIFLMFVFSRK